MARLPRLSVAGCAHHIIQRGNNRQATFFAEEDYIVYLEKLEEYANKYGVDVHAYVLMTNHVHLLLTPKSEHAFSQLKQALGGYYVLYVNKMYDVQEHFGRGVRSIR
jgi:putative transposase